jgi:hypothetical protein
MKQKVTDIVTAFMNDVTSFTSVDVSNLVKREGFSTARHRAVAQIVRELYESGFMDTSSFERTLIDVTLASGAIKQAFLYHHCMTDPDSYDKRSQIALPPSNVNTSAQTATPVITPVVTPAAVPTIANTSAQRRQKGDCRLEIPVSWVRELGWTDGDTIYVCDASNTRMEVKPAADVGVNDNVVGTIQVSGGRLRISKSAFNRSNLQHGPYTFLNVTLLNDHVLIEE